MNPDRWLRIQTLFDQAIEKPNEERIAWLKSECGTDAELFREVHELLASDDTGHFVQERVFGAAESFVEGGEGTEMRGRRAGPYRLVRVLGRGGMGTVYLGERDDGEYEGQVAVKLIRPGLDTEYFLNRFKREKQALARLQHPNIARLFDSGTTADGFPYIVMELVQGTNITAFVRDRKFSVADTVRLYLDVCRAVSHAHQRSVVHRDLKPGNILVEPDGTPKLLDFGICKLIGDQPSSETMAGPSLLTPDYASPEQVKGEPITAASDIFALGAVLYELLAGKPVHKVPTGSPAAIVKAVCETEIVVPSVAVEDPARKRELEGDLDKVLLRALEKDPGSRYATVDRFADDLRRFLAHEKVIAEPDTQPEPPGSRTQPLERPKTVPSRKWWVAAVFVLAVVLVGAWWWRGRDSVESRRAQSMAIKERADKLYELRTRASTLEAKPMVEAAIELDPENGPAHNLLAEIYTLLLTQGWADNPAELEKKAIEEAQTAIRLSPQSESARTALMLIQLVARLDLPKGMQACRDSLAVLPQSVEILAMCSRIQALAGNSEIALMLSHEILNIKPETEDKWLQLASLQFRLGRVDETKTSCRRLFAIKPNEVWCTVFLAFIAAGEGRTREALTLVRRLDSDENRNRPEFLRALLQLAARDRDEALVQELVGRLQQKDPDNSLAMETSLSLGRGEAEKALDLLEKGIEQRKIWAAETLVNRSVSKAIIGHPRYNKLLERLRAAQ